MCVYLDSWKFLAKVPPILKCLNLIVSIMSQFILTYFSCPVQRQSPEVFCKKGVLKSFAKFTGKHLCQSLFYNKVAGLRPTTLLKKRLWHRCFPVNFAKFLGKPFLKNTSGRLLLPTASILVQSF